MTEIEDREITQRWVERFVTPSVADRVRVASELNRIGVRTRGVVRTRGAASRPAVTPLDRASLNTILAGLRDPSAEVRREVAYAVGEWGDGQAAVALANLLRGENPDPDPTVRLAAAASLHTIGGPVAVEALCVAAEGDESEAVRHEAIEAIGGFAYESTPEPRPAGAAVRTRGARRIPSGAGETPTPRVLETLTRIAGKPGELQYLRRLAGNAAEFPKP